MQCSIDIDPFSGRQLDHFTDFSSFLVDDPDECGIDSSSNNNNNDNNDMVNNSRPGIFVTPEPHMMTPPSTGNQPPLYRLQTMQSHPSQPSQANNNLPDTPDTPTVNSAVPYTSSAPAPAPAPPVVPGPSLGPAFNPFAESSSHHAGHPPMPPTFRMRQRPHAHKTRRPRASHNPENHLIKHLREQEHRSWKDIAEYMNGERIKRGQVPGLTEHAVYGRYSRNAASIAKVNGQTEWQSHRLDGYGWRTRSSQRGVSMSSAQNEDGAAQEGIVSPGAQNTFAPTETAGAAAEVAQHQHQYQHQLQHPQQPQQIHHTQTEQQNIAHMPYLASAFQTSASWTPYFDDLLVRAYEETQREVWARVSEKLGVWTERSFVVTREECARRYGLLYT